MSRLWRLTGCAVMAVMAGLVFMPVPADATTVTYNVTWGNGDQAGKAAGTCSYIVPDIRPLQMAKTLVVDSTAPVGTVLYTWDFNSFLPGIQVQCTSSGITNSTLGLQVNGVTSSSLIYTIATFNGMTYSSVSSSSNPVFATTLAGIGLRLYIKADTDSLANSSESNYDYSQVVNLVGAGGQAQINAAPRDVVYQWGSTNPPRAYIYLYGYKNNGRYSIRTGKASFSVKADLVKTATTVQYGNLGLSGSPSTAWTSPSTMTPGLPTNLLTGNAITVVSPACRLRTTNYNISMGTWAADTVNFTGSPATGAAIPIGLNLECLGQVANVQFRFEDTGSAPSTLAEKNVTLYNSGGNKVNGLEIQMKYNGSRINIDGTTRTSVGSYGQVHTNTGAAPSYISAGQAMFTANYIQNGPITVGGNNYTGPVSGKVNIWVTYN